MMKKSLSLMMLVSLTAGVAMATPEVSNEWLEQQAVNLQQNDSTLCLDGLEKAAAGLAWISDDYRAAMLFNLNAYKANTQQVINNLRTGKSNAAIYNQFSNSLKFYNDKWYGKPFVGCVSPYLNYQDLARQEAQIIASKNINNAMKTERLNRVRQVQFNLANRALLKINNITKAVR